VTVRLLDCGGDKPYPSGVKFNPDTPLDSTQGIFGLRGVRFLLKEQSILRTQLKSLIRANTFGNLRVLIPFVTDVSEVRAVKEEMLLIWDTMTDAEKSAIHFPSIGAMIETPAALLTLEFICSECDFISIGSNDMAQHVLCRDRGNANDDEPFSFYHPALLRCLKIIFEHQKDRDMALSLCGEIASDPLATELLIGLGCMHLSARPNTIPLIKEIIRSIDTSEAREFSESLLRMDSAEAIEQRLRSRFEEQHGSDFFSPAATERAS
jgi:phosphotransferase system enzyme I (PtsI)